MFASYFFNIFVDNLSRKIIEIQEDIVSKLKCNSENRVRRKITPEFLKALKSIIEKKQLKTARPPLELAEIRQSFVNKYSFIQINNNYYSVPEYLVGLKVTIKIYYNKILIYSNNEFVCEHKK